MPGIHVLDYNMINKIAAGEVVERPSSVVKELVENSIDAGAKSITVEIKDGGTSLIRITDNGSGIPKEDIASAFLRHATSKISGIDDLETLMTLGFRGEALSSIASVSQVEMITKTSSDITGTRIEIHGGKVISNQEIGCTDGTTLRVCNLFYNTPARRKFLKKPAAEAGYISDIINKLALGHPEIAFKYINNNSTLIQTNGKNDLKSAVHSIYGRDVAQKLLEIDYTENGYHIKGFVGKPEISRANRSYENFFINGRFIKSQLISSAVSEGFKSRIMTGKFPVFVLNLKTLPSNVDINVHPTKLEVRFSNDDAIFNFVLNAVERGFKNEVLIPKINIPEKSDDKRTFTAVSNTIPYELFENCKKSLMNPDSMSYNITEPRANPPSAGGAIFEAALAEESAAYKISEVQEFFPGKKTDNGERDEPEIRPFFDRYKITGQLFNTYWIVEQDDSMYLIDQHAAHEKVLYDEYVSKFKSESIVSQPLLSPVAVNLSERERQIVDDNRELLHCLGFEMEEFGEKTVALRCVPNIFNNPAETGFFMDIIDKLAFVDASVSSLYDAKLDVIATISCKAAIKGNNRLSYIEAKELIGKILKLENPFNCPHGRPTIVEITKYEIEKMFKRIV